MTIETTVEIWREGQQFVARALPLDVMSSGATPEAARAAVAEAVRLFVATARDAGTLETILAECGYREDGERWLAPEWISIERQALAV